MGEDRLSCDPEDLDEDQEPATRDAAGLLRFLENEVLPSYVQRRKDLENRPLIRAQAFGESLNPNSCSDSPVTKFTLIGSLSVHSLC